MRPIILFLSASVLCQAQGVISTIAGNGANGTSGDGGPAISAALHPNGVTVDAAGNVYIADLAKSVIRKVDTAGIISTVAGNGSGVTVFSGDGKPAVSVPLYMSSNHNAIAVDGAGNIYIADDGHNRVRKVDTAGIISTVAGNGTINFSGDGGAATGASLWRPSGVALDVSGNLFIADTQNARIRKVDTHGIISTVAGNGAFGNSGDGGQAINAALFYPMGVAVDAAGNVYIADQNGYCVRKVDAAGIISTVAGNTAFGFSGDGGPATKAMFASPYSVAVDNIGNLYIADYGNRRVRKVDAAGIISTIAGGSGSTTNIGDGGPPTSAFLQPADVAVDGAGNYYIADEVNNRIRKVTVGARVPGLLVSAGSLYFSAIVNGNTPGAQIVSVTTAGKVPLGFTVSASSSGGWLQANFPGGQTPSLITVSINGSLSAGTYKGTVVATPIAPDLPSVTIPVTLSIGTTPPARPAIAANGVVNAASFDPGIASNAWVTIQGTNLASTTDNWNNSIANGLLPTSLDGVTVTFSGRPGYISYISPTQINVLTPELGSSAGTVVTNSGSTSNLFNPPIKTVSPAFFLWPGNQAVATRQDFSLAVKPGTFAGATTVAAKPGDVLILWGTGFGATTPAEPTGVQLPGDQTYSTSALPTVTVNNIRATVYGAALAPGFGGLYQVAIQVPSSLADGDYPLQASVGGSTSVSGAILSVQR